MTQDEYDAKRKLLWEEKMINSPRTAHRIREGKFGDYKKKYSKGVYKLLENGKDVFKQNLTKRIIEEYKNHLLFNYCPKCGELARTPKAKQCRFCKHDWH